MVNSEGHIKEFANEVDAKKEGYDMPLTPEEKERMVELSLKERAEKYEKFQQAQGKGKSAFTKSNKTASKNRKKMIAKSKKRNRS